MTQIALDQSGSEMEELTILDEPFVADEIDVDEIVPFANMGAQASLDVLETRRTVGELLFAREEDLAVSDVAELEAEQMEQRAETEARQLTPPQVEMLLAQARRNRILAARSRFRARHRELEILAHLKRKDGGE